LEFAFDADEILKWARFGDDIGIHTRPAIARALNAFGERVVDTTASIIEETTGADDVRSLITVYQADANDLVWEMDASRAVPSGTEWGRPWTGTDERLFSGQLYKVVNDHDDACPICEEIAEGGPYTAEEINNFAMHWAHYVPAATVVGDRSNLIHPNCRCYTKAWRTTRRVPVSMGPRGTGTRRVTAEQVGKMVAETLQAVIRARE
jgi:hypothetical protein